LTPRLLFIGFKVKGTMECLTSMLLSPCELGPWTKTTYHQGPTELPKLPTMSHWHHLTCKILPGLSSHFSPKLQTKIWEGNPGMSLCTWEWDY